MHQAVAQSLVDRLSAFPMRLDALVSGLPDADWRWRPDPKSWAIVEVVGHLLHEERVDFRHRLRLTLESPGEPWPPIDPEASVREERYIEADPADLLSGLERERRDSIAWLRSIAAPDWDVAYVHPRGDLRAGDLLASWTDHDLLHARQIVKRLHQIVLRDAAGYDCRYAGEWTA
ncbi:MAG: DinB family protein [Planctomycetota bacterium]